MRMFDIVDFEAFPIVCLVYMRNKELRRKKASYKISFHYYDSFPNGIPSSKTSLHPP